MEVLRSKVSQLVMALCLVITVSCDSPDAADCFQKAGNPQKITLEGIPSFSTMIIEDNIDLTLTESDSNYIELDYFENLAPEILFRTEGDSIFFFNENSCKFVREYKNPRLIFHSNLTSHRIISYSSGLINNQSYIQMPFELISRDISGLIDLSFHNEIVKINSNSTANMKLKGNTDNLDVRAFFNDGKIDCIDLLSNEVVFLQRGYNDFLFNVSDKLSGNIENAGRVFYKGDPIVNVNISGGGELIKITE